MTKSSLFTPLGSEDSASLRASLAAYADLLGRHLVIEHGLALGDDCVAFGEMVGRAR